VVHCELRARHSFRVHSRDAVVAEAGLDLAVAPNASLGLSWTGQFADKAYDITVKGNFTWRF
jgi:outer membrane autotransporter protein